MEHCAQKRLKGSGRFARQSTVRLGSGAGPILYSVCSMRKDVLVTRWLPSVLQPARTQVTQVGSPANRALYSGVRRCLECKERQDEATVTVAVTVIEIGPNTPITGLV